MTALKLDGLSVRYPGRSEPALANVSLTVDQGEVVAATGRTGSGKSTLSLAAAGLIPRVVRATVTGTALIDGVNAAKATAADLLGRVGIVFSSPALQLSASKQTVREELAFGLENLAVPRTEMDERIDRVLDRLRIAHLAERDPMTLSGGEQQRVAVASIVVMGTRILVLDEPAAQLDPEGTRDVAALLGEIASDGGAVLVAEHAVDVLRAAGRCLVLNGGRVAVDGSPSTVLGSDAAAASGVETPTLLRLAKLAGASDVDAFDEARVAKALARLDRSRLVAPFGGVDRAPPVEFAPLREGVPTDIAVRSLVHRYEGGVEAVRGLSLDIPGGSTVALVGQNGSGKTTLIKHLNGLLRPTEGSVLVAGADTESRSVSDLARDIGFVFQNPDDQLFNSRVDREVGFGARNLGLTAANVDRLVERALKITGLEPNRATNPYDLDISTRKLVALAGVLATETPVMVLDEPTMGQDAPGRNLIGSIIDGWARAGRTVVAVTHDMEFAGRHFERIVVMRRGEVILDGPPSIVFSGRNVQTLASTGIQPPPAARVAALMGLDVAPAGPTELVRALTGGSPT